MSGGGVGGGGVHGSNLIPFSCVIIIVIIIFYRSWGYLLFLKWDPYQ